MSSRHRSGVLILVVLCLLVLFVLVGVTYILVSGQFHAAAKSASRTNTHDDPPSRMLNLAMLQLLRGTLDATSPLHDQSLLGDMYGSSVRGTLTSDAVPVAGGLVDLETTIATPQAHGGCVLTFITGRARGITARVLPSISYASGSFQSGSDLRIQSTEIMRVPADINIPLDAGSIWPQAGDEFVLNGRPFSGGAGSENEDYDAVDDRNQFLAAIIPNGANAPRIIPSFDHSQNGPSSVAVDNDGDAYRDSTWQDLNFPVRSTADGRLYKPQFAFLCTDLDGRLNLNAHGERWQTAPPTIPAPDDLAGGATRDLLPRGHGYGPADIYLGHVLGADYANIFGADGRYGTDMLPGNAATDLLTSIHFFPYPSAFSTEASAFFSPLDLRGRFATGLTYRGMSSYEQDHLDELLANNPYELNLSHSGPYGDSANSDAPFTVAELAHILRPFDVDTATLPRRLRELLSTSLSGDARHLLTTHSFDVPVPALDIRSLLVSLGVSENEIANLLAPELLAGLRMNLNRPFGTGRDENGDGVVDDDSEIGGTLSAFGGVAPDRNNNGIADDASVATENVEAAKSLYARNLYAVVMALLNDSLLLIDFDGDVGNNSRQETATGIAQWAVNVVDFMDADSIMTRFQYDPNIYDTSVSWATWAPTETVWGCERPELLITETLAFHDRRTEDLNNAEVAVGTDNFTTDDPPDNDDDFDQQQLPTSGFFVELYNPWKSADTTAHPPGELYSATPTRGVVLNKKAPDGTPVWRMAVVAGTNKDLDPDGSVAASAERFVYFTDPGAVAGAYYPSAGIETGILPIYPGSYAVVGSAGTADGAGNYETQFGDRTSPGATRRITLSPGVSPSLTVYDDGATVGTVPADQPVVIPIDLPRSLSVSEPTGIGADTLYTAHPNYDAMNGVLSPPTDVPLDATRGADYEALSKDGVTPDFRRIHLQRLANPLKPFNAVANPYRTIDTMTVPLTAFNGLTSDSDPSVQPAPQQDRFVSHQRGSDTVGDYMLWRPWGAATNITTFVSPDPGLVDIADHVFADPLEHSLGYLNSCFGPTPFGIAVDDAAPAQPFPWLTWNNRPFISQYELMLVPKSKSSQLLHDFTTADATTGQHGHLLAFYPTYTSTAPEPEPAALIEGLRKLLEVTNVPSRFVGTNSMLSPTVFTPGGGGAVPFMAPASMISHYREPGKINLNTVYDERIWNALFHIGAGLAPHNSPSWEAFVSSRRGYGAGSDVMLADATQPGFLTRPVRPLSHDAAPEDANNLSVNQTIMRNDWRAGFQDYPNATPAQVDDSTRNAYFRYQGIQRTGNLLTTRSSVFAVWITVGYFECDSSGVLTGQEMGVETGDIKRHRAFYIIDRSIPVAYEKGIDHNAERTVLFRSFIE